jgi:hypothetical protein
MTNLLFEKVDDAYVSWIINWNIHSFTTNILNIFNGNIYFPYHNTLAYSDPYFTTSLIAFLPVKLINQPAFAYNFSLIFAFITLSFCTYLLALYITKNHLSSIAAGTILAFSSYTVTKVMLLQMLSICWVPLSILLFLLFLDKKMFKYFLFSVFFFILQMYNSFLPGYFILVSCLIILFFYLFTKRITFKQLQIKKIILVGVFAVAIILPIIIPYYQVSKEFNYVRDIRDSIRFASRPEDMLYPGFTTKLSDFLLNTFYKNNTAKILYDGFMGLVFYIVASIAILYRLINSKQKWFMFDALLIIGIFSYILSLGPAFQWAGHVIKHPFIIPLPYALFYYLAPGFNGFRDSSRWEMLFLMSFSVSIAIFLTAFLKNKAKFIRLFLIALICFGVLWEFKLPYPYKVVPTKENFPKVYTFVKNLPQNSVITEFPIYNWSTYPLLNSENFREYYGILSFRKSFNGAGGFAPPPWQRSVEYMVDNFPDSKSLSILKKSHVGYIILHAWEYDNLHTAGELASGKIVIKGEDMKAKLDNLSSLRLIYSENKDYVYKIL